MRNFDFLKLRIYPLGLILIVIFLVGLIGFYLKSLDWDTTTMIEMMNRREEWAIVIFLGLYLGLTLLGVPAIPLTLAGGAVFGLWWGTFFSLLGATFGAIATFSLTRSYLRTWVKKRFGHHQSLIRFNRAAAQLPFRFVLLIRLLPIFPFNLSNFLLGLTPMTYPPYIFGTVIGIIPGTLTYTWLGVTGKNALETGEYGSIFWSLIMGFIFCCIPLIKQRQ